MPRIESARDVLLACVSVSSTNEARVKTVFGLSVEAAQVRGCDFMQVTSPFYRDIKMSCADLTTSCYLTLVVTGA
jgi:hypothetical protein